MRRRVLLLALSSSQGSRTLYLKVCTKSAWHHSRHFIRGLHNTSGPVDNWVAPAQRRKPDLGAFLVFSIVLPLPTTSPAMKPAVRKYRKNAVIDNKSSASSDDDLPLGQTTPKTKNSAGPNGKVNGVMNHNSIGRGAMSQDGVPLVSDDFSSQCR